jgi:hypothetical protein
VGASSHYQQLDQGRRSRQCVVCTPLCRVRWGRGVSCPVYMYQLLLLSSIGKHVEEGGRALGQVA